MMGAVDVCGCSVFSAVWLCIYRIPLPKESQLFRRMHPPDPLGSLASLRAAWSSKFVAFGEQKIQACWVWDQSAVIAV